MTHNIQNNYKLIAPYYRSSPIFMSIVNGFNNLIQSDLLNFLDSFEKALDMDNANGFFLDRIGNNLGFKRIHVSSGNDEFFGFDYNGKNFNRYPFFYGNKDDVVPLGDLYYKKLLKIWVGNIFFDGTIYSLKKIINRVFDKVVVGEGILKLDIDISELEEFEQNILIESNVLPKFCGVSYNFIRVKDV